MKVDFLLVGQGLAGSLLAWHLLARGCRVLVVDRDEPATSSKVAAGLVTPLAGGRFRLPDGLEERLNYAREFYWKIEEAAGLPFFHHRRIARIFRDEAEAETWRRLLEAEGPRYERFHGGLVFGHEFAKAPHGGFEMKEGGWLDVPAFLEHTRQVLLERISYAIAMLDAEEIEVIPGGIRWKNVEASGLVFCEGWRGAQNRFFDWVPMRPTPGDILDLEIPDLAGETRILNKGGWLLPLGGGRFRAGSNYRRDRSAEPCEAGLHEVLTKVQSITDLPATVTGHRSALRPTIRRSQVFLGRHPSWSRVSFFNGLGSKGVLNGPWYAKALVDHLLDGHPLPEGSDLRLLNP